MPKVVINSCHGGYGLSKEAYSFLGIEWDGYGFAFEDDRSNSRLVRCVEELGSMANKHYADLRVVDIPEGVDWTLNEYDGAEWIAEKHRVWS